MKKSAFFMNSLIRKIYDAVRQYKFGIFHIILNRLFPDQFRYHVYYMYKYNPDEQVKDNFPVTDAITIKKVENSEEELFQKFREKFPAAEFLSRIRNESRTAFIATEEGDIAGYSWVAEKELFIESLNHKFILKDDEIFIYACFVSSENRGEGIYPAMLYEILKEYGQRDKHLAYIGVLVANKGSIKGIEKAGFKRDNRIRYVKLINYEKWWIRECTSESEFESVRNRESNHEIAEPQVG